MAPVVFGQTHALGTYAYDSSGNVRSIGPDAAGLTNFYEYDSAGRLLQFVRKDVSNGAVATRETFEYDAYGNLTKQTTNGVVASLDADADTNRLVDATYDGAGNMLDHGTESYAFDPVGTLTQKSGSWGEAFYIYTADDERIGVEGPDGTWRYMARDVDGKVLREWAAGSWNGAWTWSEDYIYRDGQLAAAVRPAAQGGIRHFHLDHLGSPRLISNEDRAIYAEHAYYPYGREITSPTQELTAGHDTPEPMKFTGHERDFADTYTAPVLDYMHARYYNPQAGRFLSSDPAMDLKKTLPNPKMWNRYSYVMNNPLRHIDPDGREAIPGELDAFDTSPNGNSIGVLFIKPMLHLDSFRVAFSDIGSAPWNEKAMAGVVGLIAAADIGSNALSPGKGAAAKGAVMLGHFPEYLAAGAKIGARTFNIPAAIWNKMDDAAKWVANQKFLDRAILRGATLLLATDPSKVKAGSFLAQELKYLESLGYKLVRDGDKWKFVR